MTEKEIGRMKSEVKTTTRKRMKLKNEKNEKMKDEKMKKNNWKETH